MYCPYSLDQFLGASFQKVSKAEEGVMLAPATLAHWQHCSQMGKQTSNTGKAFHQPWLPLG